MGNCLSSGTTSSTGDHVCGAVISPGARRLHTHRSSFSACGSAGDNYPPRAVSRCCATVSVSAAVSTVALITVAPSPAYAAAAAPSWQ